MKKQINPRDKRDERDKRGATKEREGMSESRPMRFNSYPLELLASTAARLLADNDYPQAVERALCLLDECAGRLLGIERNKTQRESEQRNESQEYEEWREQLVPYEKALARITGSANRGVAKKRYIEWLGSEHPKWTPEKIKADLADARKGIELELVGQMQNCFDEWWEKSKKRKRPKKVLGGPTGKMSDTKRRTGDGSEKKTRTRRN